MKRSNVPPKVGARGRSLVLFVFVASAGTLGCRPEPLPFGSSTPPSDASAETDSAASDRPSTPAVALPPTSPADKLERKYGGSAFYVPEHQIVLWYGGLRPPYPSDGKAAHNDELAADVFGFELSPEGIGLVTVAAEVPPPLLSGGFSGDSAIQFVIGDGDNKPSDRVRRYNLLDGSSEELPPLPVPRLRAAIGRGPDGPWVLGGFAEGSLRDDVLHLVDGAWQTLPDRLPQPAIGGRVQLHHDRVILWNADSNKSTKQHLIRKANSPGWHTVTLPEAPFEGSKYGDGATLVEFERQIFGLPGPWQPSRQSVAFDPGTEAVRTISPFPKECGDNAAKAVAVEDRILVLGAVLDPAASESQINVYTCWLDPKTGQFTVAGS